MYKQSTL